MSKKEISAFLCAARPNAEEEATEGRGAGFVSQWPRRHSRGTWQECGTSHLYCAWGQGAGETQCPAPQPMEGTAYIRGWFSHLS